MVLETLAVSFPESEFIYPTLASHCLLGGCHGFMTL